MKILLIDDDDMLREALKHGLDSSGHRVVAVRSSLEALELFNATPSEFDALITDYHLPGMNGVQLIREVLRIGHALKSVVLISGEGGNEPEVIALSEELKSAVFAYAFLQKPVSLAELKRKLK